VAIKKRWNNADSDLQSCYERELGAMMYVLKTSICNFFRALHHPNIVQFTGYHFDTSSNSVVMVTELLDNGSLYDFIHKHPENRTKIAANDGVLRLKIAKSILLS
jgi:serine/threonine protein kinase